MKEVKEVIGILRGAADLIEPEGAWCQGHMARNISGDWADYEDHVVEDEYCIFDNVNVSRWQAWRMEKGIV